MSDENKKDIVKLPQLEKDQQIGDLESLKRVLVLMGDYIVDIAQYRRKAYQAYITEGFTPEQALELCKTVTL